MRVKIKQSAGDLLAIILSCIILIPSIIMAGNLEPQADPNDPQEAMYTITDIYNLLDRGELAEKREYGFQDPL